MKSVKVNYRVCQGTSKASRRLELIIGTAGLKGSHLVQLNEMFIQLRLVKHILSDPKHICAASFLRNKSAKEI